MYAPNLRAKHYVVVLLELETPRQLIECGMLCTMEYFHSVNISLPGIQNNVTPSVSQLDLRYTL